MDKQILIKILKNVHNYYSNLLSIFVVFSWKTQFLQMYLFCIQLVWFLNNVWYLFISPNNIVLLFNKKTVYVSTTQKHMNQLYNTAFCEQFYTWQYVKGLYIILKSDDYAWKLFCIYFNTDNDIPIIIKFWPFLKPITCPFLQRTV